MSAQTHSSNNKSKFEKNNGVYMTFLSGPRRICILIVTLIYIIIEVYFNLHLFNSLAEGVTEEQIHSLERMGRFITACGIFTLLLKLSIKSFNKANNSLDIQEALEVFLGALLWFGLCYLVSWSFQSGLTYAYVKTATNEDIRRASLISVAQTVVSPVYNPPQLLRQKNLDEEDKWFFKDGDIIKRNEFIRDSYSNMMDRFKQATNERINICKKDKILTLNISSNIDKVFFANKSFSSFNESKLKKAITTHYKCMLKNVDYFRMLGFMTRFESNEIEDTINEKTDEILELQKKYRNYLKYAKSEKAINTIKSSWDNHLYFYKENGLDIEPTTSADQTSKRISRYIWDQVDKNQHIKSLRNNGIGYLQGERDLAVKNLPDSMIPMYTKISYYMDNNKQGELKIKNEDSLKIYKALVMPFVALSFSVVLLYLNILSFLSTLFYLNNSALNAIKNMVLFSGFFILIFISYQKVSGEEGGLGFIARIIYTGQYYILNFFDSNYIINLLRSF